MELRKLMLLSCLLSLLMTGCDSNTAEKHVIIFEKDSNTVKYAEAHKIGTWEEIVGDSEVKLPDDIESELYGQMSELIFTGDDLSISYKVKSDGTIAYNSRQFINLNNVINSINTKYNKNTLLNFIIKKHKSASDTVYVTIQKDTSNTVAGETSEISIHESIEDIKKYKELYTKYNEKVNWIITLTDKDTRDKLELYGCYSYIIIPGAVEDTIIDMSEYDSTR